MKKILLIQFIVLGTSFISYAQKGNDQLGIAVDLGFPTGDGSEVLNTGIGGQLKLLVGVGKSGQITATSGYMHMAWKNVPRGYKASNYIIPILAGYRQNISSIYFEPQVGYGVYGARIRGFGNSDEASTGAFTWAAGFGFAKDGLDLGMRYQYASKDGQINSMVGVRLGFSFWMVGSKPSSTAFNRTTHLSKY